MADLRNIALTIEATQAAGSLMKDLGVSEQMDVIRIGFAYAIQHRITLDRSSGYGNRGGSNYDTGGIDHDGLMAKAVTLFYPAEAREEPYRAVETLMSKGLLRLASDLRIGSVGSLSDLVSPTIETAHEVG